MHLPRSFSLVAAVLIAMSTPSVGAAEVLPFAASLDVYIAGGNHALVTADPALQTTPALVSRGTLGYTAGTISLSTGALSGNVFQPVATNVGGTVPVPTTSFRVYTLGQIVNQTSQAGQLAPGAGPAGGFGGVLDTGSTVGLSLSLVGLPVSPAIGLVVAPVGAGSSATVRQRSSVLPNAVTVTVRGGSWTTGTITFDDTALGTVLGGATFPNPVVSFGTARGSSALGASGGRVTLVAPVVVRVAGPLPQLMAGYSRLVLTIPEPSASSLLLLAGSLIAARHGRWRGRSGQEHPPRR